MFTKVPIYGQLINSSSSSVKEATTDLITATLFSLLPLWFYPIISKFAYGTDFWATVKSFIGGGELFLYSAALVGPLIFSITRKYGEMSPVPSDGDTEHSTFPRMYTIQFPYGIWFVLVSALVLGFAAYFFGILREAGLENSARTPNAENLLFVSGIMYCFTLSCFFCVSVYRLQLDSTPQEFGADTRDLMDEWETR
ncbi:hypothetical protein [Ruegeria sp. ANG-S4]|uniref:hypothetical protein n=1 Tax=Ruegeria sp. ANG-S4 TaxID=1577904 RepID=UPI001269F072|nr:hypothetical protein [Ruegeria sp. ANG-S4]